MTVLHKALVNVNNVNNNNFCIYLITFTQKSQLGLLLALEAQHFSKELIMVSEM